MLKRYWIEIILIALVHVVFLVLQLHNRNHMLDDSAEYIMAADNLLQEGMVYCGDPDANFEPELLTKRLPGYPGFLAIFRIFTLSEVPVLIAQLLLSLLSFFLLLKIFKPGRTGSLILTGFVLLFPAQFIYPNMIMSEILFQFILVAAALIIIKFIKTEQLRLLWPYQLLLIFGILVKPVLYLFVFPNIILFSILYLKTRQRLVIISSLIPLVFLIILGGINQKRTGYYHISSIQQINLIDYNTYYFLVQKEGADLAEEKRNEIYEGCNEEIDFRDRMKCLSASATSVIREDLAGYTIFHAKGMLRMFIDPGRFDIYNFFGIETEKGRGFLYHINNGGLKGAWNYFGSQPTLVILLLMLVAFVNLLRLLGFLGYLLNRQVKIEFRLFIFLLIGLIVLATGPLGASRFLLPVILLMSGASAFQYAAWIGALQKRFNKVQEEG